jgi:hypothetical protein
MMMPLTKFPEQESTNKRAWITVLKIIAVLLIATLAVVLGG